MHAYRHMPENLYYVDLSDFRLFTFFRSKCFIFYITGRNISGCLLNVKQSFNTSPRKEIGS